MKELLYTYSEMFDALKEDPELRFENIRTKHIISINSEHCLFEEYPPNCSTSAAMVINITDKFKRVDDDITFTALLQNAQKYKIIGVKCSNITDEHLNIVNTHIHAYGKKYVMLDELLYVLGGTLCGIEVQRILQNGLFTIRIMPQLRLKED